MPKKIEGQTDEKVPKSVCSQWTLSIGAGESQDQQFSSLDWKPLQAWGTSMLDIGVTVGQNVLIHFSIKTIHKARFLKVMVLHDALTMSAASHWITRKTISVVAMLELTTEDSAAAL